MVMKRITIFGILTLLSIHSFYGQQDPQYTQYMYNMHIVNPAYAGSAGTLNIGLLHRTQWVGLDGAPKTANLGFHKPIENSKLGYGINILNDRIGPSELTYMNVDISYTLLFGENSRLAFGLKVGGELINIDYSKLSQYNPGDALFQNNLNRFSLSLSSERI